MFQYETDTRQIWGLIVDGFSFSFRDIFDAQVDSGPSLFFFFSSFSFFS